MASGGTESSISAPAAGASGGEPRPLGGLAGRYAKALYALADDRREIEPVAEQLAALGRLIDGSAPLRRLLDSPVLDAKKTNAAIEAMLKEQGFSKLVCDFVGTVAANRRLTDLRAFISAFAALLAARRGVVVAEIVSAFPLTDLQRNQLRARLAEAGYSNVELREKVDPSLLGGLSVRIGARLFDATIKSRLQRLQHAMKGAA